MEKKFYIWKDGSGNNSLIILWLILLFFFIPRINYGQTYESQIVKIKDEQGASPSATFAIIEDSLGFIWFGTVDGLYRYDGYNFKVFRNDQNNPNTISNNTVRSLAVDHKGKLWIATQGGGLDCFDILSETFTHYNHSGQHENEISGNSIWSVMVDRKGNIWSGVSGEGIDRLDVKTNTFRHYHPVAKNYHLDQGQTIRELFEDEEGLIWIGLPDEGFSSLDPETGQVKQFEHKHDNESGLTNNSVYHMHLGSDGNIWISTFGGGVNIFNRKEHRFKYIRDKKTDRGLASDFVYCIKERVPGEFWIGTEYGITKYFADEDRYEHYQHSNTLESGLSENRIREIFIDSRGIVWAGTESGVEKFAIQSQFETIRFQGAGPGAFNEGIVRAICEDHRGDLWVGVIDNGIIRYSPKTKEHKHYKYNKGSTFGLPDNSIISIFEDSEHTIWLGGWNTGLIKYNSKKDGFIHVANAWKDSTTLSDNRIQLIHEEKPGIFWIGTENGLDMYDVKANKYKHFTHEEDNSNSLSGKSIQSEAFVFDNEGNIWLGTWSFGLNKIEFSSSDKEHYTIKHWRHAPQNRNSLSNDNVISLYIDKNGIVWIGTFGGGLCRLDPKTNGFINYNTDSGLPNNVIFSIKEDKNENLWLSTDHGISMFNPRDTTFQNFTKSDGLQDNHFFWGAAHQVKSGEIYFGGINGITHFIPENVKPDSSLATPQIIDIKLFNKTLPIEGSLSTLDEIELDYNQNFLSFEFAALNYKEPERNNYRYMLEGFDKTWIENLNKRSASYTNLSPGEYTLKLCVSNSDGIWNPEIRKLKITITSPWWQTNLARFGYLLILLAFTYSIYILRFRILRSRNKKLEILVKSRTHEIEKQKKLLVTQTKEISKKNQKLKRQKTRLSNNNIKLKQALEKLEQAQQALLDSEKMASLGVLTAGVAHEINNPLNFIALSVQNIKSELEVLEKENKDIDPIIFDNFYSMFSYTETGIERILTITNSLRRYMHKEKEQGELLSMDTIIFSSVKIINIKIPIYVKIKYKLTEVPEIRGHKYPLSQVIINIIENAIDAINEKKEIHEEQIVIKSSVEKYQGSKFVCATISNSGPAIPDDIAKKLFEPFYTTKQPNKGTGLGLYLSYNIIKEHNGFITVDNNNNKVNFRIYLPIAD